MIEKNLKFNQKFKAKAEEIFQNVKQKRAREEKKTKHVYRENQFKTNRNSRENRENKE